MINETELELKTNIGFTGTQAGMTVDQRMNLSFLLKELNCISFSHGDCIGSDFAAHRIAQAWFIKCLELEPTCEPKINVHPANNPVKRAFVLTQEHRDLIGGFLAADGIIYNQMPQEKYLLRNKRIVDSTDILIACPKEFEMTLRAGTWATIRYAWGKSRGTGRKVIIIPPNGKVKTIQDSL